MLDYYKFSFDGKIYSACRHRSCMFNFHAYQHMALKHCLQWLDSNKFLLQYSQPSSHSDDIQGKLLWVLAEVWHELGQDCSSKQSPGPFQDLSFSKGLFMAVYLLLHISLLVILEHFMFCSFAAHFQYNKRFPSSQDRGWDIRWWAKKYFLRNEQLSPRAEFQWMCSRDAVTRDMEEEVSGDILSPRGGNSFGSVQPQASETGITGQRFRDSHTHAPFLSWIQSIRRRYCQQSCRTQLAGCKLYKAPGWTRWHSVLSLCTSPQLGQDCKPSLLAVGSEDKPCTHGAHSWEQSWDFDEGP